MTLRIYNSYSEVFASLSWTVIHKFRQLPFNMFLKSYWFVNLALYPAKKVVLYTTFSRFKCKKFILGQAKLQSSSKGQVMDIKIWFFSWSHSNDRSFHDDGKEPMPVVVLEHAWRARTQTRSDFSDVGRASVQITLV